MVRMVDGLVCALKYKDFQEAYGAYKAYRIICLGG